MEEEKIQFNVKKPFIRIKAYFDDTNEDEYN